MSLSAGALGLSVSTKGTSKGDVSPILERHPFFFQATRNTILVTTHPKGSDAFGIPYTLRCWKTHGSICVDSSSGTDLSVPMGSTTTLLLNPSTIHPSFTVCRPHAFTSSPVPNTPHRSTPSSSLGPSSPSQPRVPVRSAFPKPPHIFPLLQP